MNGAMGDGVTPKKKALDKKKKKNIVLSSWRGGCSEFFHNFPEIVL